METGRAAESLSQAIRFKTESHSDFTLTDSAPFSAFTDWLRKRFPLAAAKLCLERVGDWGLLYTWKGRDPERPPVLVLAHYDVVPAEADQPWTKDPWGGEISEGFVWGRGAFDDKLCLISILEAAECLLSEGFQPEQGFLLAFGADEEVGGAHGAAEIGALLAQRGLRFEFCLDEGAVIMKNAISFVRNPIALIGVSEKGMVNIELAARDKSGHASAPGRSQAAVRLAKALVSLDAHRFRRRMTGSVAAFFRAAAAHARFPLSLILSHPRLFAGFISRALSGNAQASAMFRSTMAFTMLEGSAKENVLPDRVTANINLRVLPGESIDSCMKRISRITAPFGVEARIKNRDQANEPISESPVGTAAWKRIAGLARRASPDAVVMPYLSTVGTDTRHYLGVTDAIYRCVPVVFDGNELARVHSADERISLDNIQRCVDFYRGLFTGECNG
jgi:carboxypeptidase PM20D1